MGDSLGALGNYSDEERKPPVSPFNARPQSPRPRTVAFNIEHEFGPKRSLSKHILTVLEEWHKEKGSQRPPCSYGSRRHKVSMAWKVFDRNGKQLELSNFLVTKPSTYSILVLHEPDSPDKLVTSRLPYRNLYGVYLIGWLGVQEGYERQSCAIRVFKPQPNDVVFDRNAWRFPIPDMEPDGSSSKAAVVPPAESSQSQTTREWDMKTRNKHRILAAAPVVTNTNTANETESSDEADSSGDESSSATSSSEEEDEGPRVAIQASKKRKLSELETPAKTKTAKVTFRLVSYKSGAVRAFPLEECQSGKDLFTKARTFFRLFDRNVEVTILSCQITSERAQQYLFDGSEGEFSLLIDHAKGLEVTNEGTVTIEVNHVIEP